MAELSNKQSLSDEVYTYLESKLVSGKLKYSDTLNIKQLAQQLGVSTIPIRDALKRLEHEGVVVIQPRSSCYVAAPSQKDVLDAFELREMIEMQAIRSIYRTVTDEQLAELEATVSQMQEIVSHPPEEHLPEYIQLDSRFHNLLCNLAGNRFLSKFYHELYLHLNMTEIYGIGGPPDIESTYEIHRKILSYLKKNSAEAIELLQRHLEQGRKNIIEGEGFQRLRKE
jgi:DNA-binding GntR family transcriptional regulator